MTTLQIIAQVFELIIIPLLGVLTAFLVQYLKTKSNELVQKTDDELEDKYIKMLTATISDCVIATNQTYVETLKKEGKFDAEAQKTAFNKTKEAVLALLTQEAKLYLIEIVGDLDEYLNNKIEATVNINK